MKYNIGENIVGTVTEIKPYGVFLEFDDDSKGLLHISEISDAYIRDIEKYAQPGDQIKVKILSIDSHNGFLRVSYKKVEDNEKYSTHSNNNHIMPKATENEFKNLKEKLPEWVNNKLNEGEFNY